MTEASEPLRAVFLSAPARIGAIVLRVLSGVTLLGIRINGKAFTPTFAISRRAQGTPQEPEQDQWRSKIQEGGIGKAVHSFYS
jgi:hypothetical protein